MEARGDLYLDRYEGWYSVRDEAYYEEDELSVEETALNCRRTARRSNGRSRKAGSSGYRNTSSRCSTSMQRTRISSGPRAAVTRLSVLSKAA